MLSNSLNRLISELLKWPGVGLRTATRYALYLSHLETEERDILLKSIQDLEKIRLCDFCYYPFDNNSDENLCSICRDSQRNQKIICVIEKETDLNAIEETGDYRGRYLIIGPAVLWFETDKFKSRAQKLVKHLKENDFQEVILAINPTTEGLALNSYLKNLIQKYYPEIKITTPRQGLPRGAELEYADSETLKSALRERTS
jgi:recombination protein RecR